MCFRRSRGVDHENKFQAQFQRAVVGSLDGYKLNLTGICHAGKKCFASVERGRVVVNALSELYISVILA